jgi:hypothetical protein
MTVAYGFWRSRAELEVLRGTDKATGAKGIGTSAVVRDDRTLAPYAELGLTKGQGLTSRRSNVSTTETNLERCFKLKRSSAPPHEQGPACDDCGKDQILLNKKSSMLPKEPL